MATKNKRVGATKGSKPAAKKPTRDTQPYSVDAVAAYAGPGGSLSCLTVQMSDGDYRSQIRYVADFATGDPEPIHDIHAWIYSMWMSQAKRFYAIASGNAFITGVASGRFSEKPLAIASKAKLTKIWGLSDESVYVIGRDGLVLHYDGRRWSDISIPKAGFLYEIAGTAEDDLCVAAESGGLFRYDGTKWRALDVGTRGDVYGVHVDDNATVHLSGAAGFCAQLDGDKVRILRADKSKDYRCVTSLDGDVYFGAGHKGLEKLVGGKVMPFKENVFSFALSSANGFLCTAGLRLVARFDGNDWVANQFD